MSARNDDVRASSGDGDAIAVPTGADTAVDRTATTSGGPMRARASEPASELGGEGRLRIGEHLEVQSQLAEAEGSVLLLARDLRLDRLVAVRLYRELDAAELVVREREVQALARLSDPNVAAIHEVGRHEGRLFVAMEHVDGVDARAWLAQRPRSSREIVELWLVAARGLAAIHAAGIVHGEFGADRVMIGSRACVTVGSGRAADRAGRIADRTAWCASLAPALGDARTGPGWLRRLLAEAARDREEPSVAAIVAELEARTRGRARRWIALGLGAAALAGLAGIALGSRATSAPCSDGGERMATIWSDVRRDALAQHFVDAAGEPGRSAWQHAERGLDAWATRWIEQRAESCRATRTDKTQSEEVLERSMGCFDRRAAELGALLDAFGKADAAATARAAEATSALPSPLACTDAGYLLARIAPPTDANAAAAVEAVRVRLREVEALRRANLVPAASEASAGLREQAEASGYDPVRAEALVVLGRLAFTAAREVEGRELMHEAVLAGRRSGDPAITAEATARLASDYARGGDAEEAASWLELAQLEIDRGVADPDLETDVLRTRAYLLDRSGDAEQAIETYQRALARVIEIHGDHWRAAAVRNDIAITMASGDRRDEAVPVFAEVIAAIERDIGPDTPQAALAHGNLGQLLIGVDRPAEGEQHLRRAIAVLSAIHGPDSPPTFHATVQLGLALSAQSRCTEGQAEIERAAKIGETRGGQDSPEVGVALNSLAVCSHQTRNFALAVEQLRRGTAILIAHFGEDHRDVLAARTQAALAMIELGRDDEAVVVLRDVLARCAKTTKCPSAVIAQTWNGISFVELRGGKPEAARDSATRGLELAAQGNARASTVAELQCTLAEALVETGGDRLKIRELVAAAVPVVSAYSREEGEHCARLGT